MTIDNNRLKERKKKKYMYSFGMTKPWTVAMSDVQNFFHKALAVIFAKVQ